MRLFIALELPRNMMDALAETQAALRDSLRGRFTAPNTLHVTLAFLGDVPQMQISNVVNALEQACVGHSAFSTSLGELGFFGKHANATLWQGFSDSSHIEALASDVRRELDAIGVEYDRKAFRAHVTLMRHVDVSTGSLPMPICEHGVMRRVTLFASELTPSGPIYTSLHSCQLK